MKHLVMLAVLAVALPSTSSAARAVRNVAIVLYDRAEILDFAGPAEVLATAGNFAGTDGKSALHVYLVARRANPVKAQGFITITPDYTIDNAPKPDIVVIPGGASSELSGDPDMMRWLTAATNASEVTLTVCTGAFPLAQAGLLDGKDVTTWYGAIERLQASAPKARVQHGRRFVDTGRIITTAGVSAGIDGALHLAARLFGRRVADQTARYMEYHWTPEPYLAATYAYWNPSTDGRGRARQVADLAIEEKRWRDAIRQLEKLVAGDTSGTSALALGNAYLQAGDRKRAITAYRKVGTSSPVYMTAAYNLACAYALDGNKAQALAAVKRAIGAGARREQALADPDLRAIRDDLAKLAP